MSDPRHIQRVNKESERAFHTILRNHDFIRAAFDCEVSDLDMEVAFYVFDTLCYREIFSETDGTAEELSNYNLMHGVYTTVYANWAEQYYMVLLEKLGVVDIFGSDAVIIKERYMPSVKTLLIPAATASRR